MLKHVVPASVVLSLGTSASMPTKKRIERAADLPRFSYRVEGRLEDVVRDEARFRGFAAQVGRDDESVLAEYDIADKATRRELLSVLAEVDPGTAGREPASSGPHLFVSSETGAAA